MPERFSDTDAFDQGGAFPIAMRMAVVNPPTDLPAPPYDPSTQTGPQVVIGGKNKSKSTISSSTKEGGWDTGAHADSDWRDDD